MSNTQVLCLGDIADFINGDRGKNYPSTKDYVSEGIPFFSASDLEGRRVDLSSVNFISEDAYNRLGNGKTLEGDILFCLRGSLGKIGLAKGIGRGAIASSLAIVRPKEGFSRGYIYYLLSGPTGKTIVQELDNGSVQGNLSVRELKKVEVNVPPIAIQNGIVNILGTLDDKIELNRKTNETLEGIAKALFKSWFVDFDLVRAKAEGRPTGLPVEISELFPDSFEDSELGEIPSGWEVMPWGDLITLQYGKSLKGYKDSGKTIPVYGTNGIAGYTENPLVDNEGIIVGRKGAYRGIHYSDEPFFVIDTAFYVASKSNKHLPSRWCFYSMKSIDMESIDSGSAIPSTSREDFYSIEFVCPSRGIQELFEKLLAPAWRRQRSLSEESKILESLRDSLLPRLISGELRVPDAEKMLEEAGI